MRATRSFVAGGIVLMLSMPGFVNAQQKPMPAPPFGLSARIAWDGGPVADTRNVNVRLTLTNATPIDQSVLMTGTPFAGTWDGPMFMVTRNGEALTYFGRMVKRAEPTPDDYLVLSPGEYRSATINLGAVYDFGVAGEYRVRWIETIRGAEGASSRGALSPDREWSGSLTSGEIRITIGPQALQPFIFPSSLEPNSGPFEINTGGTTFEGFTPAEQTAAENAMSKAASMAVTAKAMADAALGEPSQWTIMWFGAFNATRATTVANRWANILNGFAASKKNTLVAHGAACSTGTFAYTYPATEPNKIYLCDGFWSAGTFGYDSRGGTLIHEMGHLKAGLVDVVYGVSNAQNLATTNPAQAINNADNYEYFAEDLNSKIKSPPGPGLPTWGPAALMVLMATAGGVVLVRRRRDAAVS